MKAVRTALGGMAVLLAGTWVVACGGSDGSEGPVWTGTTSQSLACQSDGIYPDGVHPEGCPINKPPPPPPPVVPCPTGYMCSVASTTMAAPLSGCSAPGLYTQTLTSGGPIAAEYLVSTCSNTPALAAWITANPAFDASATPSVPSLPAPTSGSIYLDYMPPTPTAFPSDGGDAGDHNTGQAPTALPCTDFYAVTSASQGSHKGFVVAYCVDLPSVQTWLTTEYPHSNVEFGGGEAASLQGYPDAAPGYVYLELWSDYVDIGGMCGHGCGGL